MLQSVPGRACKLYFEVVLYRTSFWGKRSDEARDGRLQYRIQGHGPPSVHSRAPSHQQVSRRTWKTGAPRCMRVACCPLAVRKQTQNSNSRCEREWGVLLTGEFLKAESRQASKRERERESAGMNCHLCVLMKRQWVEGWGGWAGRWVGRGGVCVCVRVNVCIPDSW